MYEGPDELSVFADAGRVARVLNNVIKNAVRLRRPGHDVRVRTGLVTAADGFVWWELTVSDQGRELSPQHPRTRSSRSSTAPTSRAGRQRAAQGLGLAISREIARAHGGDIYASSDAGLTSFTVWIPQGPSVARS